jgi:hypothetical protein
MVSNLMKRKKMKHLHIERFYLNRADNEYPMTVRVMLRLKDKVDEHLLAFSWWDDCVALDFSHVLIDGDSAYRLLRTLLYEYCQRRYDNSLSREGVWLDLTTEAISPISEQKEVVQIRIAEEQLMQQVRACSATPATFISLALARAIARLHPDSAPSVPTVCLAVNLRKAMGTPLAHHSMVGGLFLPLGQELAGKSFSEQAKAFREIVREQAYPDNLQAYFWQTQDRMDMMEKLPTINARHQAFAPVNTLMGQMASCMLSYVGNAFLDELRGQNLTYEIAGRHPLQLAPIAALTSK